MRPSLLCARRVQFYIFMFIFPGGCAVGALAYYINMKDWKVSSPIA